MHKTHYVCGIRIRGFYVPENCDEFWMNDDGCVHNSISRMDKRALARRIFEYPRISFLYYKRSSKLAAGVERVCCDFIILRNSFSFSFRPFSFIANGNTFLRVESSCFVMATIRANLDLQFYEILKSCEFIWHILF